jgi:hypothetical protein
MIRVGDLAEKVGFFLFLNMYKIGTRNKTKKIDMLNHSSHRFLLKMNLPCYGQVTANSQHYRGKRLSGYCWSAALPESVSVMLGNGHSCAKGFTI